MDAADIATRITIALLLVLVWIGGSAGALFGVHFLLSLPMRRAARAGLFLVLVETALKAGEPIETALVSIARSGDRTLGARFHLLAARLQQGLRLAEALATVPQFLPPAITAMFSAGQKIGDLRKVLPTCRQHLKDALSQIRSAVSYVFILAFVITPGSLILFAIVVVKVFPSVLAVAQGLGAPEPSGIRFMVENRPWICLAELIAMLVLWAMAFIYAAGPRATSWIPFLNAIYFRLPWRRKRMQRDFSAMLAVLLDAGVPEADAIRIAAEASANPQFEKRALASAARLQHGEKLTQAVEAVDDCGEFRWRLTNANHARGGFLSALAGWHEALDAKAFQQEQAAAHSVTTALVLANGVFVGAVVISGFVFLISIVNAGVLW